MPDPTGYAISYSFANFQANAPTTPLPGVRVDTELADISAAVASLVASVRDVRRSDGFLKNGIVTLDSLGVGVLAGLANLDAEAAALLDAAVLAIQTNVDADIAALDAAKANFAHTHVATDVSVSAISGIVGATVQAVLAELRLLGPQTGDFKLSLVSAAPSGWVPCDDGTISNAIGAGTTRANADCWPLYDVLYTEVSDTYAPVTGGRGASAAADFAALKPIALTKMLGRALAVAGAGSLLTARVNGQTIGVETVVLDTTMIPSHTHTVTDPGHAHTFAQNPLTLAGADINTTSGGQSFGRISGTNNAATGITNQNTGGGLAHQNMQPTSFLKAFLKL